MNEASPTLHSSLRRNAGRIVGLYVGAIFGVLLAWFSVDWPEPLPIVPRVIGWVFFVSLGALGGYAIAESSRV